MRVWEAMTEVDKANRRAVRSETDLIEYACIKSGEYKDAFCEELRMCNDDTIVPDSVCMSCIGQECVLSEHTSGRLFFAAPPDFEFVPSMLLSDLMLGGVACE